MGTTGSKEKPVVIMVGGESHDLSRLEKAFVKAGNIVHLLIKLDKILKFINETNSRICVVVSDKFSGMLALLSSIKRGASHRVLVVLVTRLSPEDDKSLTIEWSSKQDVRYVFNTRVDLPEEIVATVNNTPVWRDFVAIQKDDLTGLENRQGFLENVTPELEMIRDRRHRHGNPHDRRKTHMDHAAVLVIDGNRIKPINDVLGHHKGDEAIIAIANALRRHIRAAHHVCRKSGDEFIVWLPGYTLPQAYRRGQILMSAISRVEFKADDGTLWPISAFFGAASVHMAEIGEDAHATLLDLIDKADKELLKAKARRNALEGKEPGER